MPLRATNQSAPPRCNGDFIAAWAIRHAATSVWAEPTTRHGLPDIGARPRDEQVEFGKTFE